MIVKCGENVGDVYKGNSYCESIYIGENKIYPIEWLSSSAKQKIEDVFNEDSNKIIIATNKYMSQFAKHDYDTAKLLADYIDKDPMIVCSLDISPQGLTKAMPIRYIKLDGNSWFDTGYAYNSMSQIFVCTELIRTNMAVVGNNAASWAGLLEWSGTFYVDNKSCGGYSSGWAEVVFTPTWLTYNGSSRRTYSTTFNSANLLIGKMASATNSTHKFKCVSFIRDNVEHKLIPYIKTNNGTTTNKFLDITTCIEIDNIGTGTPSIPEVIY